MQDQNSSSQTVSDLFTPTRIRWYNDTAGAKIACVSGKIEDLAYGSASYKEFHAEDKPPHPEHGGYQWGFACSTSSRTIGLDGDYPDAWPDTETGKLLGPWRDVATSIRKLPDGGYKFHVMIEVPTYLVHEWPKQLPADFGHIKSNGFTYAEGMHATGTAYVPTGRPWVHATEELMIAMFHDNGSHAHGSSGGGNSDDFDDESAAWTDPDGDYPEEFAAKVLGNWIEDTRNHSLPARCGIIKAAGEQGTPGMRTLFGELCDEYDTETGRGETDVYRAFGRCHRAYAKVQQITQDHYMPDNWKPPQIPDPAVNGKQQQQQPAPQAELPDAPEHRTDESGQFTDDTAADAWARDQKSGSFFTEDGGLLAMNLGVAVGHMGALGKGLDGKLWRYSNGVWAPDPDVVKGRVVKLAKNKYRPSHASAVTDVVSAFAPRIDSEPVGKYVNVRNGLLDWRARTLYKHTPDVHSTVQLGTHWDPEAACPVFDWWLPQVVPADCVELAWELIGYLCYSGNPLHTAVMLIGSGRNGKGTFLRTLVSLLGKGNVTSASLADLVSVRFTTATLFGKTANIAGDIDATYLENTAILKAVTGEDQIQAEHKNCPRFDFTPWAVPVFSANKVPAASDTTTGYLSRWMILPFPNSFYGREDRTIGDRLNAELPGILAGGLRRLPGLLKRGQFGLGDSALEAKADFERRVDQVRYWLSECCETRTPSAGELGVSRKVLYEAYKRWIIRDKGKALKAGEFYDRLEAIGVPYLRNTTGRWFFGVKVTDDCQYSPADLWRTQP